jgi:hypothetical protein
MRAGVQCATARCTATFDRADGDETVRDVGDALDAIDGATTVAAAIRIAAMRRCFFIVIMRSCS